LFSNPWSRKLLLFGLLATMFSAFGQTFFIGLFSGLWRDEFGLSNAQISMIYSSATLVSGMLIIQLGRWLDHIPLPRYTAVVVLAFAAGCALIALAPRAWVLLPGILLLRLCGQGLMGHIAMTTIARYFSSGRGRALSIAQLGFPIAEASFPLLIVVALASMNWRWIWWLAVLMLLLLLPLLLYLCAQVPAPETEQAHGQNDASRRHVLSDYRFYMILPVILTAPFIITGLFFHQAAVAAAMHWPLALLATAFVVFALSQVASGLFTGWLIDRFTARKLMRFYLFPMAAGCGLLWLADKPWLAFVYMGMLGLSAGANSTISGALWAEMYGTRHIGAIRAMQHALMVVSTAVSPLLLGLLLDVGMGMRELTAIMGLYALLVAPVLGGAAMRASPYAGKKQ
jgi:MFS family permease